MKFKRFHMMLVVVVILMTVAVSCNKVEPSFNRENIKGAWLLRAVDGQELPVDDRLVYIFTDNRSLKICGITDEGDGNTRWTVFDGNSYYVYCCEMDMRCEDLYGIMNRKDTFYYHQIFDFPKHQKQYVELRSKSYELNGQPADPGYSVLQMDKLPVTYEKPDSLMGMWEFDNENLKDVLLEFKDVNTLKVYVRKEGMWELFSTEEDEYHVYSDLLVLTTFSNEYLGKKDKWSVRCFQSMKASPYFGDMTMKSGDIEYHLTKVTVL